MSTPQKINWYRCKVDKAVMSELMKSSDIKGLTQCLLQLGLFVVTAAASYATYLNIHQDNWTWALPLFLVVLFIHGTFSSFLGLTGPVHELCHKTPFKSKGLNEFFLKVYSFLSWTDYIGFRPSHVKHHQVTVHHDLDGEVVLPAVFKLKDWNLWVWAFGFNFKGAYHTIKDRLSDAITGKICFAWTRQVLPESNVKGWQEHTRFMRIMVIGQFALAIIFIATGHWPLVFIVNLGTFWFAWLAIMCGYPQHIGMKPDVPDFRQCCRTFTCSKLTGFLYWNMQYHIEHHMFPSVPFYNLPKLRKVIENDLPPAHHGVWATWKEIFQILKIQQKDPNYCLEVKLPSTSGDHVDQDILEGEAAARA